MEIDKRLFFIAGLITILVLLAVIITSAFLSGEREDFVADRMNSLIQETEDMQALILMSEFFGEEATCVALESMTSTMNSGLWELGTKLDRYRQATEEFSKDPFYLEQKKKFNRREVIYFSLLNRMQQTCSVNQTIVSYFFKKKEECPDCDAQSFVLSDLRRDLGEDEREQQLTVFSFDTDLGIPTVDLLVEFYNITTYPCIVVESTPYCGLKDKQQLKGILCNERDFSIC